MKKVIQTVLFDFDGVLLDSVADIAAAVNAGLSNFNCIQIPEEKIRTFIGNGAEKLLERSLLYSLYGLEMDAPIEDSCSADDPSGIPGEVSEKKEHFKRIFHVLFPWYIEYYRNNCAVYSTLYPGVPELLVELHQRKIPMAVVSNKPLELSHRILSHFGLERFFGSVAGPESTARLKPAPDGLLFALRELKGSPETTLMVGDTDIDIQAARAAGVISCAFTGGFGNRKELLAENADIVIDSLEELLEIIEPSM
ncbi:MAG: HAD-IA family hydrolase [Spirochaetaceae bacterium]|jgi:2-phosphoglycolate phosphatase|nr:HAD-IA family hydrolase [Spirochaetaceae bacterium]